MYDAVVISALWDKLCFGSIFSCLRFAWRAVYANAENDGRSTGDSKCNFR